MPEGAVGLRVRTVSIWARPLETAAEPQGPFCAFCGMGPEMAQHAADDGASRTWSSAVNATFARAVTIMFCAESSTISSHPASARPGEHSLNGAGDTATEAVV